jgi:hypothetical protein
MAPIDDDVLEKLLKGHLSARLDGQLGRAESAFGNDWPATRRSCRRRLLLMLLRRTRRARARAAVPGAKAGTACAG